MGYLRRHALLLVALGCTFLSANVLNAGTISGRLIDPFGHPIAGAKVEALCVHDNGWIATVVTDAFGYFCLANVDTSVCATPSCVVTIEIWRQNETQAARKIYGVPANCNVDMGCVVLGCAPVCCDSCCTPRRGLLRRR
jgi:hypothetical protein